MGTTSKALRLLDYFTPSQPDIGLSELARQAAIDKASTYRLLNELREMGFVEQNAVTKSFRLGPAVIRLANVREQTFPLKTATAEQLAILVETVHETAHVTQVQGLHLSPIHKLHSQHHGTHARIDPSQLLPLHATASGSAVLAFSDDSLLTRVLDQQLPALTPTTNTDVTTLRTKIEAVRAAGFGSSFGEFEAETSSLAAPYFGMGDQCLGAVSVVCPTARMTNELALKIKRSLMPASLALTAACGGRTPSALVQAWARHKVS